MDLHFQRKHLSIEQFSPVSLPDFVVLTGVNGSGKSHLLDAISNGNVSVTGVQRSNIVLFNYETFRLDNEGGYNAQQITSEKEQAWNYITQQIVPYSRSWRGNISSDSYKELVKENSSLLDVEDENLSGYKNQVKSWFNSDHTKQDPTAQSVYSLIKKIPTFVDELEKDDFIRKYKPFSFKNNFLPNQIGKIFWDYYVKLRQNQVNGFENEKHGQNYTFLSDADFESENGPKPWELVNDILTTFDSLQYKVKSPEGMDIFGSYHLQLIHVEKPDVNIDFNSLSSGEKILMALVASIYKSSSDGNFPDLLLLDEVDASLHPSMMKNMLNVIEKVFIKNNVKVILVTHSPTTIALAPEESIYVMNRSGLNRISKKDKSESLSILTQGYATIDQGLKLFDEATKSEVTIVTEGNNTKIIEKALELYSVSGVEVLNGIEGISGKNQLKTLFEFLSKTTHDNKVIFVWDCDVNYSLKDENNTYPFIFPKNTKNSLCNKGIENLFPETLFDGFIKTISPSKGDPIRTFDASRKRDFEESIIQRNNKDDFYLFQSLFDKIQSIKNET